MKHSLNPKRVRCERFKQYGYKFQIGRGLFLRRKSPRKEVKGLARARIDILWEQANKAGLSRPDLARQWMRQASRIAQKARIKLPRFMQRRICRECGALLVLGKNCRFRIRHNRSRHLSVTCLECGTTRRFYL